MPAEAEAGRLKYWRLRGGQRKKQKYIYIQQSKHQSLFYVPDLFIDTHKSEEYV